MLWQNVSQFKEIMARGHREAGKEGGCRRGRRDQVQDGKTKVSETALQRTSTKVGGKIGEGGVGARSGHDQIK